jgi:DNA-binding NtrC family response regulator
LPIDVRKWNSMPKASKVLIVDDDPELLDALTEQLSLPVAAQNGGQATALLESKLFASVRRSVDGPAGPYSFEDITARP